MSALVGPLRRVLIANRGEIAIRIAKAADGLGIETVAIYPPADERSLHTRVTTDRRALAATADPIAAYLDVEAVVALAVDAGCDCVHPGYGFLAEHAGFAERCAAAGITFIGPRPDTLALFGDKVAARSLARRIGVPVLEGSAGAVASAGDAARAADAIGYPVMLKAAAGGGGRGLRAVTRPEDLPEAFERCRSEATTAFGNGDVFVERLLARPRHIEVQVLADTHGHVVHLFDRDCSVQLRNQKVIEIAPAPGLDAGLRGRILGDAVKLAEAAEYVNAGTVEFLVSPEAGEHAFIECNPRIQVEHTVTEQVTGVDLVEAQFRIAGGATLAELGLGSQDDVVARGHAVQARLTATGAGVLRAYQEPSGAGIRVDAVGYAGYAPPPQFDPLLAKVIATSTAPDVAAAVDRARRAVASFHLAGLPTNRAQLLAILEHPAVLAGDARTTLLAEAPELVGGNGALAAPLAELGDGDDAVVSAAPTRPALAVGPDQQPVRTPMGGTVIDVRVAIGDLVRAGDGLLVISAMKMEAVVTSPCAGAVVGLLDVRTGDQIDGDVVVAVVAPADVGHDEGAGWKPAETWLPVLEEVAELQGLAAARLAPGSEDPGVVRQRSRGKLTCRERIALLLDDGSFREVGSLAGFTSYDEDGRIAAFTPANHVGGWGTVEGRMTVVCADDFTSRGGHADGAIGAKSFYLDQLSLQMQVPSVRLLDGSSGGGSVTSMVPQQKEAGESTAKESSGAIEHGKPRVSGGGGSFLPGHLGSTEYAEQLATVPVVNVLLGSVVGIGAAKAVLGHFSVMVRDISQLFVAGPPVVSHAMGYDITKEELGGWQVHCRNGSVDNLAETEEEAVAMTKRFLSYLPSSVYEAPPVVATTDATDRREEELLTIIPRKRTTTFDVRRVIELLVDRGSWFEMGALWGTDQVVGLARFDGHPVGVIASDSRHANGGALTADGCDKLIRHVDVCDLFHLPIINLIDNPGFTVGLEHEQAGTIRKGGEWMVAMAQAQVPMFSVLMRRSFGVAGNNQATPTRHPNVRVTWPAADVGGIPPEGGIEAAYKRQLAEAEDPVALRAELEARIESVRGPIGPLNKFQIEELIDPRDTRRYVCEWIGPATRVATAPPKLTSRALQFRP